MRQVKWVFLGFGIGLLVWVVHRIGLREILENLRLLGWRLSLPILVFFPTYLFYTLAWRAVLKGVGSLVPFWRLFRIKLTGEAANAMTPINFAGGDPLRVWLLSRDVPATVGGATAVVDRTLHIFAILTLTATGTLMALIKLDLPAHIAWSLTGTVAFFISLTVFFLSVQQKGLFERLSRWSSHLKIRRFSEGTLVRLRETDRQLIDFYRKSPWLFWRCFLLHLIARGFGILEIYLLARLLGVPMSGWQSLFFATVIPMTNFLGAIVPGAMGILEGVVGGLFYVLGWSPADGVALQVARRLRSGFWISWGSLFFLLHRRHEVT